MINSAGFISFVEKDKPENIINDSYEYINDSTTSNLKALKTVIDNSDSTFSTANLSIGNHIITLTVYDKWGKSSKKAINVNVLKNYSPTAILKLPIGAFKTNDQLTLNGGSSYDTDGSITKYLFSSNIDGELSNSSSSYTYEYLSEGTHTITLTVTDNHGATSSTTETITINPPEKPQLSFSGSKTADVNRTANFSVTSDKSDISYVWYIDGVEQNSYKSSFSYIFTNIGNYLVSVKGTSENVSSTASINVEAIERNVTRFLNVPRTFTRDDVNNIVTELTFGLKWEDTNHSKNIITNYNDANSYCENLELGGITNWRVPTLKELWYLYDRNLNNTALSSTFKNVENGYYTNYYWSNQAVTYSGSESYNWTVVSSYGYDSWQVRTSNLYIRCVSGESHYENINFSRDNSKNIVIDNTNNLMWQDGHSSGYMTWNSAIDYCKNLDFAGYSDWRLASIEELHSITDQRKNSAPFVNQSFQNISSDWYWSSTTVKSSISYSWKLDFSYGDDGENYHNGKNQVRCLRNNQ